MAKLGEYGDRLPKMTAQEVFEVGCDHLLTQNRKSDNPSGSCLYNGQGDICCAAAPFINSYDESMEGQDWSILVENNEQPINHANLICELQRIHDCVYIEDWPRNLQRVASIFGLKRTKLLTERLANVQD